MIPGPRYVPALDGLRGVAVMAVIVSHTWPAVLPGGWAGVDIFFVLSGYLITSLLLEEKAATGSISFRNFYVRRALRLFPALGATLIGALLIAALVYPASLPDTAREAGAAAFYVANWTAGSQKTNSALLFHTWTLSIEEQFYWTWPLVLSALLLMRRPRVRLALVAGLLLMVVLHRLLGVSDSFFRTDTRADSLLTGCLLAMATASARSQWQCSLPLRVSICTAACALSVAIIFLPQWTPFTQGIGLSLLALLTAAVILGITIRPWPPLVRTLSVAPLLWVGKRSYGVYLYHALCWALVATFLPREGAATMLLTAATTLIVARFSYRYLEMPFLRRRRLWQSGTTSLPIAEPALPRAIPESA